MKREPIAPPSRAFVARTGSANARVWRDDSDFDRRRARDRISVVKASRRSGSAGEPICVRLCDGYFFPVPVAADATAQAASCNTLCPDAPTDVYYRSSLDKVDDAVNAKGQPYTALPVSLRYRTTSDNTCSCHRDAVAYAPLQDTSLRRGDAVMTPAGFVVFEGVEGAPHGAGDFAALAKAPIETSQRVALLEMERASLPPARPSLAAWVASQTATRTAAAQPAVVLPPSVWTPNRVARAGDTKIRLMEWRGASD